MLKLNWKIDSYESFNAEQHHEPKILYNRVFINYFESHSILYRPVGILIVNILKNWHDRSIFLAQIILKNKQEKKNRAEKYLERCMQKDLSKV